MKSTILAIITALVLVIALFVVMKPVETKVFQDKVELEVMEKIKPEIKNDIDIIQQQIAKLRQEYKEHRHKITKLEQEYKEHGHIGIYGGIQRKK